jgi:gliding motility-associated-like protein
VIIACRCQAVRVSGTSNTINLTIAEITVSSTSPVTDDILPGQTKVITVTTDAQVPAYTWTRNGSPIANTTATLNATQDGVYVVTVTQTSGCPATEQKTFTLNYPSAFNLTVAANTGYTSCVSATATLNMAGFTATTLNGIVDVTAMGYTLQWYKDNMPVSGETSSAITLNNASQNGDYKLGAAVPGFGTIFSNIITVNLSIGTVTIDNDTALCSGGTVVFTSDITNAAYNYQWFKDGIALGGATSPGFTANAEGDYYLEVTAGSCIVQSNTINLTIGAIAINSTSPDNDVILPGQTKTITVTTDAQGPVYSWTRNGVALSTTTATLNTSQDGEYIVTVTQTTGCSATVQKTFILEYPSGFDLAIAADASYTACTSSSVTLNIASFTATTTAGDIDVSTAGYAYQWHLNGVPVSGETSATLTVSDAAQNGIYTLVVAIPGFEPVISNAVTINLNLGTVDITAAGSICVGNPTVEITSNTNNALYTYAWYKDGALIAATTSGLTATQTGDYYVVVNTGTCTYTSNTVTITEGQFNLTTGNITEEYVIPGESLLLSVSTDASSPQYEWYRNGVLMAGETSSSLTVTLAGEYKIVVTQTTGCVASNELTFTVAYPTDFQIDIEAAGYLPCSTTSTPLTVLDFSAATPNGPVDVAGVGYGYQWYLDNIAIAGATTPSHQAVESGDYYLEVAIPEIGTIVSNTIAIHLGFEDDVTISSDGILCSEGGSVTLSSDANNPAYAYKWYNEANAVIGTESTLIVSEPGSYYLAITYQSCIITSNILDVELFNEDLVTLDSGPSLSLLEGSTATVTASGAESYEWFLNGTSITTGPSITITGPGTYSVVASVGECQVTKTVNVTTRENNLLAIPNVVTPNNDGFNDKWVLPVKYAEDTTEVVIYGPDGSIVFRASNYNNNWPENDFTYSLNNPVYYYTIMEKNEITERGSITLIK